MRETEREFPHSTVGKNFVKVTFLLKNLLNNRFDEIFFSESSLKFPQNVRVNSAFFP